MKILIFLNANSKINNQIAINPKTKYFKFNIKTEIKKMSLFLNLAWIKYNTFIYHFFIFVNLKINYALKYYFKF